jgi:hypothetical protein
MSDHSNVAAMHKLLQEFEEDTTDINSGFFRHGASFDMPSHSGEKTHIKVDVVATIEGGKFAEIRTYVYPGGGVQPNYAESEGIFAGALSIAIWTPGPEEDLQELTRGI